MTNDDLRRVNDLEDQFPGHDRSYVPIYNDYWSSYEEGGFIFILERQGQLYALEYQSSVYCDNNTPVWNPSPISDQEALDLIDQWDESMREFERNHGGM